MFRKSGWRPPDFTVNESNYDTPSMKSCIKLMGYWLMMKKGSLFKSIFNKDGFPLVHVHLQYIVIQFIFYLNTVNIKCFEREL